MSEPTKRLPSEENLQRWVKSFLGPDCRVGSVYIYSSSIGALAREILRLRAELAKASAAALNAYNQPKPQEEPK